MSIQMIDFIRMVVNDDIEAIAQVGEELTAELNSKYEGLNPED
jgi:hypothetical protein